MQSTIVSFSCRPGVSQNPCGDGCVIGCATNICFTQNCSTGEEVYRSTKYALLQEQSLTGSHRSACKKTHTNRRSSIPCQHNVSSLHHHGNFQIRHALELMRQRLPELMPGPRLPHSWTRQAHRPSPPCKRSNPRGASSSPTRCRTTRRASRTSAST